MVSYILPLIAGLFLILSAVFGVRSRQGHGEITLRVRRKLCLVFGIVGAGLLILWALG